MSTKPTTVIDRVCGMTVTVATAEANGLTIELDGRTYAFCRAGCRRAYEAEPITYLTAASALPGSFTAHTEAGSSVAVLPVIDEGCDAGTKAARAV